MGRSKQGRSILWPLDCFAPFAMNAFTVASPKQRVARSSWRRKVFSFFWGAPLLIWQGAFFFAPLIFLIVLTFWSVRSFRVQPDATLKNWIKILTTDMCGARICDPSCSPPAVH